MWYLKKMWVDQELGIDAVVIHYTCTPLGWPPDWRLPYETRLMEKNAKVKQGLGGTTLVGEDQVATLQVTERPALAPPNARVKVLRMPGSVWNPETSSFSENYLFHYFFEVWQQGRQWTTPPVTEEIVSKEIEYVDWLATFPACVRTGASMTAMPLFTPQQRRQTSSRSSGKTAPYARISSTGRRTATSFPASNGL